MRTDIQLSFCPMDNPPSKKLLQAFYRCAGWSLQEDGRFKNALKPSRIAHWVSAEFDGVKIGLARLQLVLPESCYVSNLIIRDKFTCHGIGKWFIKNIELHCGRLGIKRMMLAADSGREPFYEALSFVPSPDYPEFLMKEVNPLQKKVFYSGVLRLPRDIRPSL